MADPAPPAAALADAPAADDAPAAPYAPDADTWDHVVRAAAHCGQLEAAALLMRATRAHAHDPELLARTRGVRGECGRTLLMRAVMRCDVARAAEIVIAAPTPPPTRPPPQPVMAPPARPTPTRGTTSCAPRRTAASWRRRRC